MIAQISIISNKRLIFSPLTDRLEGIARNTDANNIQFVHHFERYMGGTESFQYCVKNIPKKHLKAFVIAVKKYLEEKDNTINDMDKAEITKIKLKGNKKLITAKAIIAEAINIGTIFVIEVDKDFLK